MNSTLLLRVFAKLPVCFPTAATGRTLLTRCMPLETSAALYTPKKEARDHVSSDSGGHPVTTTKATSHVRSSGTRDGENEVARLDSVSLSRVEGFDRFPSFSSSLLEGAKTSANYSPQVDA